MPCLARKKSLTEEVPGLVKSQWGCCNAYVNRYQWLEMSTWIPQLEASPATNLSMNLTAEILCTKVFVDIIDVESLWKLPQS